MPIVWEDIWSAKKLDTLVVLGGEGPDFARSEMAGALYTHTKKIRYSPLPLITTGKHSGLCTDAPVLFESERAKLFLMAGYGVPAEHILTEKESLDTIANFYFARPLLEQLQAKQIGVVTDGFHTPRAMRIGAHVLGPSYTLTPFSTTNIGSRTTRMQERVLTAAIDTDMCAIAPGNKEQLDAYMQTQHPFHAPLHGNIPTNGWYNRCVRLHKLMF